MNKLLRYAAYLEWPVSASGNLTNDTTHRLTLRYVYIKNFKYVRGNLSYTFLIIVT